MKHLRRYNESKEEPTLQDVKDILLELEDEGFKVKLRNSDKKSKSSAFYILIEMKDEYFKYQDVKEVLLRLKDYLEEYLLSVNIVAYAPSIGGRYTNRYEITLFDDDGIYGIFDDSTQDFTNSIIWELEILSIINI